MTVPAVTSHSSSSSTTPPVEEVSQSICFSHKYCATPAVAFRRGGARWGDEKVYIYKQIVWDTCCRLTPEEDTDTCGAGTDVAGEPVI